MRMGFEIRFSHFGLFFKFFHINSKNFVLYKKILYMNLLKNHYFFFLRSHKINKKVYDNTKQQVKRQLSYDRVLEARRSIVNFI